MKEYREQLFVGERALFAERDANIYDSVFRDGESPLKESRTVRLNNCIFEWKYPLWYSRDVELRGCTLLETARSGIWYTHGITAMDTVIDAPKTFRRSSGIRLSGVVMPKAQETLWSCSDVVIEHAEITGDYFGMNSQDVTCRDIVISGNYAFDGAKNVDIRRARLISKDAFWNCENVTVYDSLIIGEYLGWNSKNVTFVNCTVESNQGMCYMDGITMKNCKLINTDLAFEYSSVDAEISSHIVSVKNPASGRISARSIGTVIHDGQCVDTSLTVIETKED